MLRTISQGTGKQRKLQSFRRDFCQVKRFSFRKKRGMRTKVQADRCRNSPEPAARQFRRTNLVCPLPVVDINATTSVGNRFYCVPAATLLFPRGAGPSSTKSLWCTHMSEAGNPFDEFALGASPSAGRARPATLSLAANDSKAAKKPRIASGAPAGQQQAKGLIEKYR